MSIFKKFDKTIEVNGHMLDANIVIEVDEDGDCNVADDIAFDDVDAEKRYLKRFEHGELFAGVVTVTAYAVECDGFDSLSACPLHSNNMFDSGPFNNDVNQIVEEHGMVKTAIEQLVANIQSRARLLKRFA